MTNMTQASATEKKGASDLLRFKIFGMPLPLYAFALITLLLSHFYNAIPTDLVGGFAGNDSNLLIVFYVQIMPDDFVMQLHRF